MGEAYGWKGGREEREEGERGGEERKVVGSRVCKLMNFFLWPLKSLVQFRYIYTVTMTMYLEPSQEHSYSADSQWRWSPCTHTPQRPQT